MGGASRRTGAEVYIILVVRLIAAGLINSSDNPSDRQTDESLEVRFLLNADGR